MRRIVFVILGLFAVFTMIRAYAAAKDPVSEKPETLRTEEVSYAEAGAGLRQLNENL